VVATSIALKYMKENSYSKYPWSPGDSVDLQYFNNSEHIFLPLTYDEHLRMIFSLNAASRFGQIRIHVQPKVVNKGKRVKASPGGQASPGGHSSCVSANSVRPDDPCRSTTVPSLPSASVRQIRQIAPAVDVENVVESDDAPLL
jgi:hypothetical protein